MRHLKTFNEQMEFIYIGWKKGDKEGGVEIEKGSENETRIPDYFFDNGYDIWKISKKEFDAIDGDTIDPKKDDLKDFNI